MCSVARALHALYKPRESAYAHARWSDGESRGTGATARVSKSKKVGGHAAHLRRGDKSVAEIRRYADELRGRAAELAALAQAMQESGLAKVHLDGVTKLDRALPEID